MASGQIRMTPEVMRERAGQYRTEYDNLGDIITNLNNLLETLQSEWEGAASDAYAAKFDEFSVQVYNNKADYKRNSLIITVLLEGV